MAPSSAGEHVGVLRDAGLVSSRRRANSVIHPLTPLGHAMLTPTNT
jgi:DNA-binding transcriptional ArsR family regulator